MRVARYDRPGNEGAEGDSVMDPEQYARLMARVHANCEEVGDCLLWRGAVTGGSMYAHQGTPCMHWEGKTRSIRRLVYAERRAVPAGYVVSPKCGNRLCVSKSCLEALTAQQSKQRAAKRGAFSNPAKNRAGAMTKRANSWITEELVSAIKEARTAKEASELTGVSLSHSKAIRSGSARRDYSNPFAGLGG